MHTNPTSGPPGVAEPAPADWRELAACTTTDPDAFFADKGDSATVKLAKRVCAGCPVRTECLECALSFGSIPGVWGGTSERERRALRRGRGAA